MPDDSGPKDPLFGYIERFASVMVAAGMPPMPSRVFVALMVTDSGRLTAAELAGCCGSARRPYPARCAT